MKLKNYKFYITEGMRKWQFDITESAQLLYCINLMVLFTGYAIFISKSQSSTTTS